MTLELVGGYVAEELGAVATFNQREALSYEALQRRASSAAWDDIAPASRGRFLGQTDERIAFHHFVEDRRTRYAGRHEQTELP